MGIHKLSKEQALLQELLKLIQRFNEPVFLLRPFDLGVKQDAYARCQRLGEMLQEMGYKPDHKAYPILASVQSVLEPSSPESAVSFDDRIAASKSLHDLITILSPRTALPIQNQHLPHDILVLIFDEVLDFEDPLERRKTMHSLALTSIAWSKIAFPRCISDVFLGSVDESEKWLERSQEEKIYSRQFRQLDYLRIRWDNDFWEFEEELFKEYFGGMRPKHESVEVAHSKSNSNDRWYAIIWETVQDIENCSLSMPVETVEDHREALHRFIVGGRHGREGRKELKFDGWPAFIPLSVVEQNFSEDLSSFRNRDVSANGDFLHYTKLATPFLPFTIPLFLLEQPDRPLPPSRLEHLEITLVFDPSDPRQNRQEIQRFFQVISPKIEHLTLRIRLSHSSDNDFETTFTEQLMDGITSLKRLRHFGIGGFGFKYDTLLSRLSELPLESLNFHSISPPPLLDHFSRIFATPSTLRSNLKVVLRETRRHGRFVDDAWSKELKSLGIKELCSDSTDDGRVLEKALVAAGMVGAVQSDEDDDAEDWEDSEESSERVRSDSGLDSEADSWGGWGGSIRVPEFPDE
ncbi:hypothetical protein JCM3765_000060 [Sporobolomyces pararoseus]